MYSDCRVGYNLGVALPQRIKLWTTIPPGSGDEWSRTIGGGEKGHFATPYCLPHSRQSDASTVVLLL